MDPRAPLTVKQKLRLRALGHHLDPVVQLGKRGLTEGAQAAVNAALGTHELVKVRIGTECPDETQDIAGRLGPDLHAQVAQILGRTILLYRRHPNKPKIDLDGSGSRLHAEPAPAPARSKKRRQKRTRRSRGTEPGPPGRERG